MCFSLLPKNVGFLLGIHLFTKLVLTLGLCTQTKTKLTVNGQEAVCLICDGPESKNPTFSIRPNSEYPNGICY